MFLHGMYTVKKVTANSVLFSGCHGPQHSWDRHIPASVERKYPFSWEVKCQQHFVLKILFSQRSGVIRESFGVAEPPKRIWREGMMA
jgi:hypothetical protein